MKHLLTLLISLTFLSTQVLAQAITLPPSGGNQKSVVTQYIGSIASVSVKYSSPDVTSPAGDDRTGKIWGQLVPYGLTDLGFGLRNPSPWRAGANENTVIKFSHDVVVEGQKIPAGKYGLHLIVEETGPWTWIFSKNHSAWGSYFYDEKDDVARVEVTPEDSPHHEWLTYEFRDRQPNSTELVLSWEKKAVPMRIMLEDVTELYAERISYELQSSPGFNSQNWAAGANFLVQNDHNLDLALEWADAAISAPFVGVENFNNLQAKASVLTKMEKMSDAQQVMMKAVKHPTATSGQIHNFGRQLISMGEKEKALEILQFNYDRFEGAWPTNVGMARGLSAVGRYEEAYKYAEAAYAEAPDQVNKDSMKAAMKKLKQKLDIN